ncbi:MAG: hypothetical protein PHY91_08555 [Tissierellia bacterium]|nr:hypothetical protein [Tissierellia bacterium]MDD4726924.1 hypothetical protein [Tissierellia bacterium]
MRYISASLDSAVINKGKFYKKAENIIAFLSQICIFKNYKAMIKGNKSLLSLLFLVQNYSERGVFYVE